MQSNCSNSQRCTNACKLNRTSSLPLVCATFHSVFLLPLFCSFYMVTTAFLWENSRGYLCLVSEVISTIWVFIFAFQFIMMIFSSKETSTMYRYKRLEKNTDPCISIKNTFPSKQRSLKIEDNLLSSLHWFWVCIHMSLPTYIKCLPRLKPKLSLILKKSLQK